MAVVRIFRFSLQSGSLPFHPVDFPVSNDFSFMSARIGESFYPPYTQALVVLIRPTEICVCSVWGERLLPHVYYHTLFFSIPPLENAELLPRHLPSVMHFYTYIIPPPSVHTTRTTLRGHHAK